MKMVYIASPLRGDYNQNIKNAVEYCRLATESGVLALAPHIIFSQWCNDSIPEQREQGLKLGLSLLEKAEELWVMGSRISEGMKGEIDFAREYGIPILYVEHAHSPDCYPISGDAYSLLSKEDCEAGSSEQDYSGRLVVLRHDTLKPEYRTSYNQLWLATHGPGCASGIHLSDTVHLTHPIDGDRMCVARHELCGAASPATLTRLTERYPALLEALPKDTASHDEDFCR